MRALDHGSSNGQKYRLKMLIKINIFSIILSLYLVLIWLSNRRPALDNESSNDKEI